jgi:hypothetical protein
MIYLAIAGAILTISFAALPISLMFLSIWRYLAAIERQKSGFVLTFNDLRHLHVEQIRPFRRIGDATPGIGRQLTVIKADKRFYLIKNELLTSLIESET